MEELIKVRDIILKLSKGIPLTLQEEQLLQEEHETLANFIDADYLPKEE